jgi:hypothetical protein
MILKRSSIVKTIDGEVFIFDVKKDEDGVTLLTNKRPLPRFSTEKLQQNPPGQSDRSKALPESR